jgi:hypothetical protein
MLANNVNSPINAVKIFLDSIKNKQYLKLNDVTINTSDFEHHEKYMKNYLFIDDKVKVNNYYVGEARLLNDKINSIVQFWIINDEKSEYGWLKCRKVNGEWKIYKNI